MKFMNVVRKYGEKLRVGAAALGGSALAAAVVMFGAVPETYGNLPAAASTAITGLETDASSMIDLIWGPVVIITVGFVLLKLFKRGANRV